MVRGIDMHFANEPIGRRGPWVTAVANVIKYTHTHTSFADAVSARWTGDKTTIINCLENNNN